MSHNHTKSQPQNGKVVLIFGGILAMITLLGTLAIWPPIASWLPKETVTVKMVGSDKRMSGVTGQRGATSSAGFSIKVVDENGYQQNISCPKPTYEALTGDYGIASSIKLVRNPLFKTPVAFLKQRESLIKYSPGSALEKLNSSTPPATLQSFPVVRWPVAWFICGLLLFALAIYTTVKIIGLWQHRAVMIPACIIASLTGIGLGLYMTSGI
ncbi:hypothetical protein NT6N_22380 [Oceaniferula spumae]|uniref:DUF3592 domain-containing protein n=1 Tax=Oceaniferula spumae TaxID=2979115 RepID=A0AAT9FMM0_9BACT